MVNEYSLISLDEVKKFIGMSGSTSNTDDLLEDLIDRVSTIFESCMDRNILSRSYTEFHNGNGATVLYPRQPKITTISGIWDDYNWEYTDDDIIDTDNYKVIDETHIVFKNISLNNYTANIKITYTAGYTSTPDDLKQICISEVARIYKNRNQVDILSKSLSDGSVSLYAQDFLPLTLKILNRYRRIVIV